jgi:hypothetical protein
MLHISLLQSFSLNKTIRYIKTVKDKTREK